MRTQNLLYTCGMLLVSLSMSAQEVSKDSMKALNQQKEAIQISEKVNEDKIKLAKLENELAEKVSDVEKKTQSAQKSADENQSAASALINNAQDEKLADNAKKAARIAERDAKDARKAADDQADLQKDIDELKKKIAENEAKLGQFSGVSTAQSSKTDSTQKIGYSQYMQQSNPGMQQSDQGMRQGTQSGSNNPSGNNAGIDNNGSGNQVAQKVVESTYKNYPQQTGQPSIIINNIIVPADYNRPKATETQPAQMQSYARDREDYEDYKAWLRQRENGEGTRYNSAKRQQDADNASSAAQSPESRNRLTLKERFGELPARNSGLWVIPMVGVHASGFEADFKDNEAEGRTGWNAGLDFRIHMKRFFIQPGVHYLNSSIRFTSKDSISEAPLLDGPRIHSLKVPVMLGLYLTKANSGFFKFNIKAGAVGNYILAVDKSNISQFSKNNIEDFTYGLNAGLGFEFGLITLDLSHEWGVSKYFKNNDTKNNILRLTLGVKI